MARVNGCVTVTNNMEPHNAQACRRLHAQIPTLSRRLVRWCSHNQTLMFNVFCLALVFATILVESLYNLPQYRQEARFLT